MKFKFNKNVIRTYWAILALLVLLAVVVSYQSTIFPIGILVGVPFAIVLNYCITRFYFKLHFKFPTSTLITSLIIIVAIPQSTYIPYIIFAIALAELSKSFIKLKGRDILNPAALGLAAIYVIFGVGSAPFSWVNANSVYFSFPLLFLLILAIYSVKKIPAALSFGAVFLLFSIISLGLVKGFSVTWIIMLLSSGYYTIAFIMLSDPKTSPKQTDAQYVYGAGVGFLTFVLSAVGVSSPFPISIVLGNIANNAYTPAKEKVISYFKLSALTASKGGITRTN